MSIHLDIQIVRVKDLNAEEKDRLLQEILEHLGRDIEATKWPDSPNRTIGLSTRRGR